MLLCRGIQINFYRQQKRQQEQKRQRERKQQAGRQRQHGAQDDLLYLEDLWEKFYPDDPGFTWIGKGWKTGAQNPYGTDGNPYAIENGPPERIDYIVFFKGSSTLQLNPFSIKLFPEYSSGFQVSDHLGLVSVFNWQN